MNKTTKITSRILALVLALSTLLFYTSVPAFAEETGAITIDSVTYEYSGSAITKVTPMEGVTEVTIPDSLEGQPVTGLQAGCFADCGSITKLNLPNTLTDLHPSTFEGLSSLTAIDMPLGGNYFTRDGALLHSDAVSAPVQDRMPFPNVKLVYYPPAKTDTYFMPPYGVTEIESGSLANPYLETLELPGTFYYHGTGSLDTDLFKTKCPNVKTLVLGSYPAEGSRMMERGKTFPFHSRYFLWSDGAGSLETIYAPFNLYVCGDALTPGYEHGVKDILLRSIWDFNAHDFADENGFRFQEVERTSVFSKLMQDHDYQYPLYIDAEPVALGYEDWYEIGTKDIQYSSLDETVATIDANGVLTPVSKGSTYIYAYIPVKGDHNASWSCSQVNVIDKDPGLVVAGSPTIYVKPTAAPFQLKVTTKYADPELTFTSSNEDVATVDETGLVTLSSSCKPMDETTIKVTSAATEEYGEGTAKVVISIDSYSQTVTIDGSAARTITYGSATTVKATAKTKVTYKSSDTSTAKVDSAGKVTFLHPGTVTITAVAAETDTYDAASRSVKITSALKKPTLKVTRPRRGAAKLTWSKVPGATHYIVYVKKPGAKSYKKVLTRPAKVKSVTHSKLKRGKTYRYKVRAVVKYKGKTYYGPYSEGKSVRIR